MSFRATTAWIAGSLLIVLGLLALGCPPAEDQPDGEGGVETDFGVDLDNKVLTFAQLNDESGPGAAISVPFAIGKRVLAAQVNAGGSGLMPEGWTIKTIEKDHGYNPQQSVQLYKEVKDDILFVGTSFGTPNTLPLIPMLETDTMIAFPASLSSQMAHNEYTPPAGPSYYVEAMRGMDWCVAQAGGADEVKAGIVYQQDDYGLDGIEAIRRSAEVQGFEIVSEQTVVPGQEDYTAPVTALKEAGATHVLLTVLPSSTGPILGTAAQLQYAPVWVGVTPSWVDAFFSPEVIPSAVFGNFHWVTGLPYWGEELDGMDEFLAAWEAHGKDQGKPDFYTLVSYLQGRLALEAFNKALENGDVTRAGFKSALQGISGFTAGGMLQPLSYTSIPYPTSVKTRVLKPDFDKKSWTQIADYAEPKGFERLPDAPEPAPAKAASAAPEEAGEAAAGEEAEGE